ncbi:right-handed parallel beta-helix repeat-containing protein [Planosporangium thailandense]|uniref:right-handed parallel beta-helix repeat-containing protein n=1 Tax=Planosporangium thailandense TaxID=765197 RepID=UPI0030B815C8
MAPAPAIAGPVAADPLICNAHEYGIAGDGVTNDQPALQALVDSLGAAYARDGRGRVIYCPPGRYSVEDVGTVWRSGVSLVGAGPGVTRFLLSNPGRAGDPVPLAYFTALQHGAGRDNHLADCTFARFEIDGAAVHLERYDVLAKGLGIQYMVRARFRDLYIHDTGATGLGCDFLQDTMIESVLVERCGRLDTGEEMGGAGIGIGIGGWGGVERLTISDCTAVGNGTNGIFLELQRDMWPPPRGIRIVGCHAEGNRYGISDWGADGLIVSSCTMIGNVEAGYDVSGLGTSGVAGRGGTVANCVIDRNAGDGLGIGNTPGPYSFTGNRITGNGRYGYRQHDTPNTRPVPASEVALMGNVIRDNGLDGIRVDAALVDGAVVDNRICGNGRRSAPATSGAGDTVTYGAVHLVDRAADWLPGGHVGKWVTVDGQRAVVVDNTATELFLAPYRPGATTAWRRGLPRAGARYSLPDPPPARAGITIGAGTTSLTVRGNRVWDSQHPQTQTYGLWITDTGSCSHAWFEDNNLEGNADAAARFDTEPAGGCWGDNHGLDDRR